MKELMIDFGSSPHIYFHDGSGFIELTVYDTVTLKEALDKDELKIVGNGFETFSFPIIGLRFVWDNGFWNVFEGANKVARVRFSEASAFEILERMRRAFNALLVAEKF